MTDPLGRPDAVWQRRWWMWASWLPLLGALALAGAEVGRGWNWSVFVAGVVVALAVVVMWVLPLTVMLHLRRGDLRPHERMMARHRIIFYGVTLTFMGTAVALAAAMFDTGWILVFYVCLCALTWILTLLAFLVVMKRIRRQFPRVES